jgi:hypothetical protein
MWDTGRGGGAVMKFRSWGVDIVCEERTRWMAGSTKLA